MVLVRALTPVTALLLASAAACSGVAESPSERASDRETASNGETADPGSANAGGASSPGTIARLVVERSVSLDGASSAQAMAHFVELTPGAAASLEQVGLHAALPDPSKPCRTESDAPSQSEELFGIELLEAGTVEILLDRETRGTDGIVTLAPHAFPSISSLASGLVYTTRDRSAHTLPSGIRYDVRVNGAGTVPALAFSGQAPEELTEITLGGVPVEAVRELDAAAPLDLTWEVGSPGDVVVVEFKDPADGSRELSCSFADDLGTASIAPPWLSQAKGKLQLSVRRLRQVASDLAVPGANRQVRGELLFDFEVIRILTLGDRVVTDLVVSDTLTDLEAGEAGSVEAEPAGVEPTGVEATGVEPTGVPTGLEPTGGPGEAELVEIGPSDAVMVGDTAALGDTAAVDGARVAAP